MTQIVIGVVVGLIIVIVVGGIVIAACNYGDDDE